jgi:hypothetical protein
MPHTKYKMDPDVKRAWTAALRSGDYTQGKNMLCAVGEDGSKTYCCLGVLAEIAVKEGVIQPGHTGISGLRLYFSGDDMTLPLEVMKWAGLEMPNPWIGPDPVDSEDRASAAELNDYHDFSFEQIADRIDEYL